MNCSDIALRVLAARECGFFGSNAQFWKAFESFSS